MLPILCCLHLGITALTILHLIGPHFKLINLQDVHVHFSNLSATEFEPEYVEAPIDIQIILLCIAFEKFSLGCNVVLLLFLFFFVNEVIYATCSVCTLC